MYYPIQIPYVLDKAFAEFINYSEEIVPDFQDFVICLWEMQPLTTDKKTVENIIVSDGCIDLVADYDGKRIGFAGMSKTNFHYKITLPAYSMGARFKPGAFYAITNIPATKAMDNFLPISIIDKNFDIEQFFKLKYSDAKLIFKNYVGSLIENKKPSKYMSLFEELNNDIPNSALEVYSKLYYSHRQCQRLFSKNYGLSPQMVLCILRFQWCLKNLVSGEKTAKDIMDISNYYDQSHFIHDFKQNIGLTPLELVRKYTS
jgi:AraC-like DNA-binding protein